MGGGGSGAVLVRIDSFDSNASSLNCASLLFLCCFVVWGAWFEYQVSPRVKLRDSSVREQRMRERRIREERKRENKVCLFGCLLSLKMIMISEGTSVATLSCWVSSLTTKALDVHSFGIIMWQIVSTNINNYRLQPYSDFTTHLPVLYTNIVHKLESGVRPSFVHFPKDTPPQFYQLTSRCWDLKPEKQPIFLKVIVELTNIQKLLPVLQQQQFLPLQVRI